MKGARKRLGDAGEEIARRELVRRGYVVRERNWRCPEGELDIVAEQGEALVFVEVRTRRGDRFGTPEESITAAKRRKMRTAARRYCQSHDGPWESWRIDFVAVELNDRGKATRVEIFENAVGEE